MEQIGMVKIFHRVRIGPGKGACLGRVGNTIVFDLPGGPPSNHVALFLLTLSGVRRLMGCTHCLPRKRQVSVTEELTGQKDWTQLVYSSVKYVGGSLYAVPLGNLKRLEAMAKANALIEIPEGCAALREDALAGPGIHHRRSPTKAARPGMQRFSPSARLRQLSVYLDQSHCPPKFK